MGEKLNSPARNSAAQGSPVPANLKEKQPNPTEVQNQQVKRKGEIEVSLCQHILLTRYCK
jgi:hypothetical protein